MRAARILIVDDDPLLQKSLGLFLSLRGYEVEGAMTGHDALTAFARRRPDLVVLDRDYMTVPVAEIKTFIRH